MATKATADAKKKATQVKSETLSRVTSTLSDEDIRASRIEARIATGFGIRGVLSAKAKPDPAGDGADGMVFDGNFTDRDNRAGNTDAD